MKLRKLSAATAILASGALVLSGCTPGEDNAAEPDANETTDNGAAAGGGDYTQEGQQYTVEPDSGARADLGADFETVSDEINVSVADVNFVSYNGLARNAYNTTNSAIVGQLGSGFWYYGSDLTINQNEEFGSYEVIEEGEVVYEEDENGDPLLDEETGELVINTEESTPQVVEYTISDDAVWSDGTPITVADFVLAWGVQAPGLENPDFDPEDESEDAEPPHLFDSVSKSFGEYVPNGPEGELDGKTFTVEYSDHYVYVDWQLVVPAPQPAHVVAEQGGISVEEMAQAFYDKDGSALVDAAEFWNTGWHVQGGELPDSELTPSSGKYLIDSFSNGEYISLVANPEYWGTPAGTERITFHFIGDGAMPQALENGDLDVIAPQPTVDTLDLLNGMNRDIVIHEQELATWEHLDLNHSENSVFNDPLVREAFAMCVPRQLIVDNLIKPLYEGAELLNAREVFNYQPTYDEITSESYDGRYDEQDLERAAELLEEAGVDSVDISIGYQAPNPRRTDQVQLIAEQCGQAGFNIEDGGHEAFFAEVIPTGDWDVALFAWAGSGQIASGRNLYHSAGGQNDASWNNEELDALWDELVVTMEEEDRIPLIQQIEKILWDDLMSIPLFVHPGIFASDAEIYNVRSTASQNGITWNADQWQRAAE
ncbi:ABC transporter substrate-binding protein [Nesterenkonia massiliensis]|uniref:ABC transporter substrate-binding protein n=1 Tax=Nesterenkonia massiliensis TaxID=1232429 RepID=A0ABT2HMB4_9MICC|nr:ABC transporter substrate-binding protein [Nesterenkonia massiliensis]